MLEIIAKYIREVSVLRRLLFAVFFLSPDLPDLWNLVVQFALDGKCESPVTAKQAKALSENIQLLNSSAFATDELLFKQIIHMEIPTSARPLGVPLISNNNQCLLCDSHLLLRRERPAQIVVYDDSRGSIVHVGYVLSFSTTGTTQMVELNRVLLFITTTGNLFPILFHPKKQLFLWIS